MKTYVQPGEKLDYLSAAANAVGVGIQLGSLFGVAQNATTAAGQAVVLVIGPAVVDVVKAGTQAWTVGQKIYWDNTAKNFTNVVGSNLFVGHAVAAVAGGAGDTTGRVRLHGAPT